ARVSLDFLAPELRIEVDHRTGRNDAPSGHDIGGGDALGERYSGYEDVTHVVLNSGVVTQALGKFHAERPRQGKAPGCQLLDVVPLDVDRAPPLSRSAGVALRQQRIDARCLTVIEYALEIALGLARLAGIGRADRAGHVPFAIVAQRALQPRDRAHAAPLAGP